MKSILRSTFAVNMKMMIKKQRICLSSSIRLSILFICLSILSSCYSVEPLLFERTENFSVNKAGDQTLLNFNIVGHNPNKKNFKVSDFKTTVTADGHSFASLQ